MAEIKHTMRTRTIGGVYDTLFPKTIAEQVITDPQRRFVTDGERAKLDIIKTDNNATIVGLLAASSGSSFFHESTLFGSSICSGVGSYAYRSVVTGHGAVSNGIATDSIVIGTGACKHGVIQKSIFLEPNPSANAFYRETYNGIGIGNNTLGGATHECIAIGPFALAGVGLPRADVKDNVSIGFMSGKMLASGVYNVFVGNNVAAGLAGGSDNTFVGHGISAGSSVNLCVAIGRTSSISSGISNAVAIGAHAHASASNMFRLGTTTHNIVSGNGASITSDRRDKTDISDLTYDYVEFIKGLRPRNYRMNFRDDYRETFVISTQMYDKLSSSEKHYCIPRYEPGTSDITGYEYKMIVNNDGSKKRTRQHNGLIADEVKELTDRIGFDFAGYRDHSFHGDGTDEISLDYGELHAPHIAFSQYMYALLVKCAQALNIPI